MAQYSGTVNTKDGECNIKIVVELNINLNNDGVSISAKPVKSEDKIDKMIINVEDKIRKYAFSGGRDTLEEHRRKGGNPDIDVSFQYLKMFFEPDDKKLQKIHDDYKSGKMLTSELKKILIDKINAFLKEHQKKRESARKHVDEFLLKTHSAHHI